MASLLYAQPPAVSVSISSVAVHSRVAKGPKGPPFSLANPYRLFVWTFQGLLQYSTKPISDQCGSLLPAAVASYLQLISGPVWTSLVHSWREATHERRQGNVCEDAKQRQKHAVHHIDVTVMFESILVSYLSHTYVKGSPLLFVPSLDCQ